MHRAVAFGQRTYQNMQRRGFVFEGHLPSPAGSMTKGCGGRCSALLPASGDVTHTQCFSTHNVEQDKCSEQSLTSVWKPHLFLPASHFGDIFAYSIKLSVLVLQGGISVIVLLCLCCCFYLYLSILILGSAVLCKGVLRHDTLQCILNILKSPQALAHTLPLSHYNPNKRTLMSVLHLYCLQRAHWELTDSIFHASAAGEISVERCFTLALSFFS